MGKARKTVYDVSTKTVVDAQTGEVGTVEHKKRYKVSVDSEPFYMVFIDYVAPFFNLSSGNAKNVLAWLCTRAQFNTGRISLSSQDRDVLCTDLNLSKSNLSNIIKELQEKKLISGERGSYIINPQIFWKGDLLARNALLDVKDIQVAFSINLESANLKEE